MCYSVFCVQDVQKIYLTRRILHLQNQMKKHLLWYLKINFQNYMLTVVSLKMSREKTLPCMDLRKHIVRFSTKMHGVIIAYPDV